MTMGACQCTPKNQFTVTGCWLFSAKAKSVKKMKALTSQTKTCIARRF
jgi:hypothetical protein